MQYRFLIVSLLLSFVTTTGLADSPDTNASVASKVGISETKPDDGPAVEVDGGFMVPYVQKIPGTDLTFQMIPVPSGSFLMGSPDSEADRFDDEGPQFKVNVDPMWVAKTEVTWAQYEEFMNLYAAFKSFEADGVRVVDDSNKVDAITAPTELYDSSFTYEYGNEPNQAAVSMTQYSSQQFSKWISKVTGVQYRLPTEAEWEYAARGGTDTAFHWGNDPDQADQYAWFFDNAGEGQKEVGLLKPNPFGLHDMLGNVAEWTVNAHTDDYTDFKAKEPINATAVTQWPELGTECVVRGGHWGDDVEALRCAARLVSDDAAWKEEDPNFPLSPWWFTSDPARGVGFRLFRSYKPLDSQTIQKFWEPTAEDVVEDVESRILGGRGGLGLVDPKLPEALKELNK
jgi:formylglycine-generating enzyme required for sulfatase activity